MEDQDHNNANYLPEFWLHDQEVEDLRHLIQSYDVNLWRLKNRDGPFLKLLQKPDEIAILKVQRGESY